MSVACGCLVPSKQCTWCRTRRLHVYSEDAQKALCMPLQVAGLTNNLTTEYNNFLNFLTTTPTAIQTLINDAKLLNAQLNAVRLRAAQILLRIPLISQAPRGSSQSCLQSE